MNRHALRHRATPPLNEAAWPLYVLLCAAQRRAANQFEFIIWLTARVRPYSLRHLGVEEMKRLVLDAISAEISMLCPDEVCGDGLVAKCLQCSAAAVGVRPVPVASRLILPVGEVTA